MHKFGCVVFLINGSLTNSVLAFYIISNFVMKVFFNFVNCWSFTLIKCKDVQIYQIILEIANNYVCDIDFIDSLNYYLHDIYWVTITKIINIE